MVIDEDCRCIGHTSDDASLQRVVSEVAFGRPLTGARGAPVSSELFQQLLAAAPRDAAGSPTLVEVDFTNTTFTGDAVFAGATFTGDAVFAGATFTGDAVFDGATFSARAVFDETTFTRRAGFGRATFSQIAQFSGATFSQIAQFSGATFTGDGAFVRATFSQFAGFGEATFSARAVFFGGAFTETAWFVHATFTGEARFDDATFTGDAWFGDATFTGDARFDDATFTGDAWFGDATFTGDARFDEATFEVGVWFVAVVAEARAQFVATAFEGHTVMQIAAPDVGLNRARLTGGGRLLVGWGTIDLTDAEISSPVLVDDGAAVMRHRIGDCPWVVAGDDNGQPAADSSEARWPATRPVAVTSLRRATVTGLQLGPLDLRTCRFAGAHDLDRLRLPHAAEFHQPPSWWRSRRQVLTEEIVWRRSAGYRKSAWARLRPENPALEEVDHEDDLQPEDVAELYRSLRIGREARGDAPGAADFYYGEIEMRRRAATTPRMERWVLWLYWALSGYALRAFRALTALAVVVALATTFLALRGYEVPTPQETSITGQVAGEDLRATVTTPAPASRSWDDALWTSLEAVTLRSPATNEPLTEPARRVTTTLRFVGPVLLGLAVLSVRGRVKR